MSYILGICSISTAKDGSKSEIKWKLYKTSMAQYNYSSQPDDILIVCDTSDNSDVMLLN